MPGKKILLAGSTGYIGKCVLKNLLSKGHQVICIGRKFTTNTSEMNHKNLSFYKTDICTNTDHDYLKKQISSLDAIISCIGTRSGGYKDSWNVEYKANKNLLALGISLGLKQFILLSAICVQKPRLEFQFAKLAFEKDLIDSGVPYTIVRPTAYFKSLAGQIKKVMSGKSFIFFDNGTNTSCKPISERNLAQFICDCLVMHERKNKILPIGGPGLSYTPRAQAELIFKILNQTPKIKSVPSMIFNIFGCCVTPFSVFSQKMRDLHEFSRIGHYYATESMLLWSDDTNTYSSDNTPEFGNDKLDDFYRHVVHFGLDGQELGKHKLF